MGKVIDQYSRLTDAVHLKPFTGGWLRILQILVNPKKEITLKKFLNASFGVIVFETIT
jgi:hypothetical protein